MPGNRVHFHSIIGIRCVSVYFIDMKSRSVQVCDCACYLAKNIRSAEGELPSAQRIHNLLYLATRESTCIFGEGLVPCTFRCTDDGVLCENCSHTGVHSGRWIPAAPKMTKNVLGILNSILATYGSWNESELRLHILQEKSWNHARETEEDGILSQEMIAEDAQKVSRLNALWSMSHCSYDPVILDDADRSGCLCFGLQA